MVSINAREGIELTNEDLIGTRRVVLAKKAESINPGIRISRVEDIVVEIDGTVITDKNGELKQEMLDLIPSCSQPI